MQHTFHSHIIPGAKDLVIGNEMSDLAEKAYKTKEHQFPLFTVAIPAYNEEEGLEATLKSLSDSLDNTKYEIIVVDDGSIDKTADIASKTPGVRLIRHERNLGYGAAIQTATLNSKADYIIWFDSDGQHRTEDLLSIAQLLEFSELDYVIGQRDSRSHEVFNRRFGKALLRSVVRLTAGRLIRDFNCGLRGFKRNILLRYLHLLPHGFGASTTTTLLMIERKYTGCFHPVIVLERIGKSTVRQLRDGMRTLMLIFRIFLMFKPMLFFGSVGTAAVTLGASYGIWEALTRRQGFSVLAASVIIFGFQSLFFGLICDQIAGIRRERMEER